MIALTAMLALTSAAQADSLTKLRMDFATYNPVSLVLKEQGFVEKEFANDGIAVEWSKSAGSNVALEGLDKNTIDFGSSAGAAALMARAAGSPIKSIYVYSRPEWTALVVPEGSPLKTVADLKGKKIAVTKGTDPHIFLLRALETVGLTDKDITIVPLQHADGRKAMLAGEVDAWAGLDPMMAQAELDSHARLLFRDPYLNTYGVLNVREDFLAAHGDIVARVIKAYEEARQWSLQNPDGLKAALIKAAAIDDAVAARQLERTDLRNAQIGNAQVRTIKAAGEVLQRVGIIPADQDVAKLVDALIDRRFATKLSSAN
ncbi:MAG TPA: aliphatic sulfonate ABC transporter substrate-binding protein [Stellaceae bacterium]|nr:aliphatic sulfonate ABC transporter substrate-binding protein [Stellaceae bacterium]